MTTEPLTEHLIQVREYWDQPDKWNHGWQEWCDYESAESLEDGLQKFAATKNWCAYNPKREYRLIKRTSEILDNCYLGAGKSHPGSFEQPSNHL